MCLKIKKLLANVVKFVWYMLKIYILKKLKNSYIKSIQNLIIHFMWKLKEDFLKNEGHFYIISTSQILPSVIYLLNDLFNWQRFNILKFTSEIYYLPVSCK